VVEISKGCFPIVSYAVQSRGPVLSGLMLDNGLALLAAHLLKAGYNTKIFDYNNLNTIERISQEGKEEFLGEVINELHSYIRENDAKVIGLKLYANGFSDSVRIAKQLKQRNPDLFIVAGGPHVAWFGQHIYSLPDAAAAFDMLVAGEGDVSIIKIAEAVYKSGPISDVPNALYRSCGGIKRTRTSGQDEINVDELPHPVYDREIYAHLEDKISIPVIEDRRGCTYGKCVFCAHPIENPYVRERNIDAVVAEIESNQTNHALSSMRVGSSSPSPSFLHQLARTKRDIRFTAFGRADSQYDFGLLNSGLVAMFFGIESADEHLLENVLRKTRDPKRYLENARRNILEAKKNNIATVVSMIVPAPFETEETMKQSHDFLIETMPDFVLALPAGPVPGTPLYLDAKQRGAASGVLLPDGFDTELMLMDLDLLRPSEDWHSPFGLVFDGEVVGNPFSITGRFLASVREKGMMQFSDDIVLMAHGYYGSLDKSQDERRKQCSEFSSEIFSHLARGNADALRTMIQKINQNVSGGARVGP